MFRRPQLAMVPLEAREVPALIADPIGDILPTFVPKTPGVVSGGMDVVAHEVVLLAEQERMVFYGKMAGSVAATQDEGGLYLFGVDRGLGTTRFLNPPNFPPEIGPNVKWDLIVAVRANGTGFVNNPLTGVLTPLDPSHFQINGDELTASIPLSAMMPAATRPPSEWTYNLWPRNGIGSNLQVSDLAPDDGNSPVQVVAPARVADVTVNDGSAQRSMVNRLTVTFDGPVTLAPGAFELVGPAGAVDLTVAASVVDGRTVAVLTFSGPDIVGGSLADGSYTLTIHAARVHDRFGRDLDGDADGLAGGDRADGFHRLFGDADGDKVVDESDRDAFRAVYEAAGYLWYFDFDSDGDVDGLDNGEFSRRFGRY
ncbi:MAG TPA: hypothetical protein VM597_09110 [Gemmataceae bacterium]|nr:hypothetical protein [Gemmataceae bacterium]